jgi:hypothetical protein
MVASAGQPSGGDADRALEAVCYSKTTSIRHGAMATIAEQVRSSGLTDSLEPFPSCRVGNHLAKAFDSPRVSCGLRQDSPCPDL